MNNYVIAEWAISRPSIIFLNALLLVCSLPLSSLVTNHPTPHAPPDGIRGHRPWRGGLVEPAMPRLPTTCADQTEMRRRILHQEHRQATTRCQRSPRVARDQVPATARQRDRDCKHFPPLLYQHADNGEDKAAASQFDDWMRNAAAGDVAGGNNAEVWGIIKRRKETNTDLFSNTANVFSFYGCFIYVLVLYDAVE